MYLNDESEGDSDCDIDATPTLAERMQGSDLIIAGTIDKSTAGDFTVLVEHVLKGNFSKNIFTIQDKDIDNGCYDEALAKYIKAGEFVMLFLVRKGNHHLIDAEWNIVKYTNKNAHDYRKDAGYIKKSFQSNENKRKRGLVESQDDIATTVFLLMEERSSLFRSVLTRGRAKRVKEIDEIVEQMNASNC